MGLDNYFRISLTEGETAPEVEMDREPQLCGGMLSGNGRGSFRGKVYASIVEKITGTSLYEDRISGDDLIEMGQQIEEYLEKHTDDKFDSDGWEVTRQELADLAMCFGAYGKAEYHLASWY